MRGLIGVGFRTAIALGVSSRLRCPFAALRARPARGPHRPRRSRSGLRWWRRRATSRQQWPSIRTSVPGWTRDGLGNLIMRRGSGQPRRRVVVSAGIHEAAYVISEITRRWVPPTPG